MKRILLATKLPVLHLDEEEMLVVQTGRTGEGADEELNLHLPIPEQQ